MPYIESFGVNDGRAACCYVMIPSSAVALKFEGHGVCLRCCQEVDICSGLGLQADSRNVARI